MNIYIKRIISLSEENKFLKMYLNIINNALDRASTRKDARDQIGYIEGHHIIPKAFDITCADDSNNLVFLTAKEHIWVHFLMCKFIKSPELLK